MKRRHNSSPQVKLRDANGRASLNGLRYDKLGEILTMAALHCHDSLKNVDVEEKTEEHRRESRAYHNAMLKLINATSKQLDATIRATHPWSRVKREPTVAERLKAVKESRAERLLIDRIVRESIEEARRG
jgi:hypothetical protein